MKYLTIKVNYALKKLSKIYDELIQFNISKMRFDISLRSNLEELQKKMKYWFCMAEEISTKTE